MSSAAPLHHVVVTVTKHGPAEYSWSLVRSAGSCGPADCVAESSERFADYDQAMDEGFEALKKLRR